jgi:hypothetical protein
MSQINIPFESLRMQELFKILVSILDTFVYKTISNKDIISHLGYKNCLRC